MSSPLLLTLRLPNPVPESNALPATMAAPEPLTSMRGPVNATFTSPPWDKACRPNEPMPVPSPPPVLEWVMIVPPALMSTVPVADWVEA
ncbi:hypothetical protein D3C86_1712320 [compost metagenome]